jgi:hypothetical protein
MWSRTKPPAIVVTKHEKKKEKNEQDRSEVVLIDNSTPEPTPVYNFPPEANPTYHFDTSTLAADGSGMKVEDSAILPKDDYSSEDGGDAMITGYTEEELSVLISPDCKSFLSATFSAGCGGAELSIQGIGEGRLISILETYLKWAKNLDGQLIEGRKQIAVIPEKYADITFTFECNPTTKRRPIVLNYDLNNGEYALFSPELAERLLHILTHKKDVLEKAGQIKEAELGKMKEKQNTFEKATQ